MKTINMIADTVQQFLLMIQNFVAAANEVSVITKEAMEQASAAQRAEHISQLAK